MNKAGAGATNEEGAGAGNEVATGMADAMRARQVFAAIIAAAVSGLLPLHVFVDAFAKSTSL